MICIIEEWWLVCVFELHDEAAERPNPGLFMDIQDSNHEWLVYPQIGWCIPC